MNAKGLEHLTGLVDLREKHADAERQLSELNALLEPLERKLRDEAGPPERPACFVIGPPRSGTTVLTQLLAATGLFQVTNNFVARFWKAPALAIRMSRAAGLPAPALDLVSDRGRTHGLSAPHEFGYFWSSWFDLGQSSHTLDPDQRQKVDLAGLSRAIGAMEAAATQPLLFKNNTWCTYQADLLARLFPAARFVVCQRDPFFVAQSILEQRRRLGDETRWWSVRPRGSEHWKDLPPLHQVARQTTGIYSDMEDAIRDIPVDRVCKIDYQHLCSKTRPAIDEILHWLGFDEPAANTAGLPDHLETTDTLRLEADCGRELRMLLEHYQTEP